MINNDNFDKKLLETIKEEKIAPRPKWQFIVKNYAIWIAGFFSLLFGSLATSLIIYMSQFDNWDSYIKAGIDKTELFFLCFPFFWLIFLAVFVYLIYYNLKNTKKGYRYSMPMIIVGAILVSACLGYLFHLGGIDEKIDDILGRRAPFYERIMNPRIRFMSEPDKGKLSGLVVKIDNDDLVVVDMFNKEWNVNISKIELKDDNQIKIHRPASFIGKKISDNNFKAKHILVMHPGKGFFGKFERPPMPPMPPMPLKIDCFKECKELNNNNLNSIFIKHPEIKNIFIESLSKNKNKVEAIINSDPEFNNFLKEIGFFEGTVINFDQKLK